jgi:hypothetical protein
VCPEPKSLELFLDLWDLFLLPTKSIVIGQRANSRKENHKIESRGHKNECDGLTLGKIIFGYTPRVVLPPQQPFSNAMMEQVQRWGEDVSNDGMDAISAH